MTTLPTRLAALTGALTLALSAAPAAAAAPHSPAHPSGAAAESTNPTSGTTTSGITEAGPAGTALAAKTTADEDPSAYLFAYFTADSVEGEKISLAVSDGNDAQKWIGLNDGRPVLDSDKGTKGLRDPFIVRAPEGNKFYLIATDLSIGRNGDWDAAQRTGSRHIEVWESTDLVNWGEQRHVEVAPETAGNVWAPEAYWDDENQEYVVFWASKLYAESDPEHSQSSPPETMMYATTKDFKTFSDPKVWQDTKGSRIDSTVIKDGDTYYRYTKDEENAHKCADKDIFVETSKNLTSVTTDGEDSGWTMGQECIGHDAGTKAVEGPTAFKANPGDVNGEGYYLFADEFGGRKYLPLKADSPAGPFEAVGDVSLPDPAPRHGTVLPITESERQALLAEYPADGEEPDPIDGGQLLHYDFSDADSVAEGSTIPDSSGNEFDAMVKGKGATEKDGVLTLPGGAANSNAAYLELPQGAFDHQDELTISVWLRNKTGAGNYAAMFFGSKESTPANYWLLNPANPAGLFKSVITGSTDAAAPWSTETGVSPSTASKGIAGPKTSDEFSLYTTVIEPGKLTGYLDGKKIGTVDTGRSVSDLGKNLVGYVGRSSYNDPFYKGDVRDVSVLAEAQSEDEVAQSYLEGLDEETANGLLAKDAKALSLPKSTLKDLDLPAKGQNGSDIAWSSSDTDRIGEDGAVSRGSTDQAVTLTATLSLGSHTTTRDFEVTVLSDDSNNDVDQAAKSFDLGVTEAWKDLTLADEFQGTKLTWASSDEDAIAADGTVTRSDKAANATLTATFTLDGASATKEFPVTVLPKDTGTLYSYTTAGDTKRTDALHLATAKGMGNEAKNPVAGNNGKPVLYPTTGSARVGSPVVFRDPAGGFRVLAPEISGKKLTGKAYVYSTKDLVRYTDEALVDLAPGQQPTNLSVDYDNATGAYTVTFTDADSGDRYAVTSKDLKSFGDPETVAGTKAAKAAGEVAPRADGLPSDTADVASVPVTASELGYVSQKLGRVHNTDVAVDGSATVAIGADRPELPETADVKYSSGSSSNFPVTWDEKDLKAVDTSKPGTYTVNGTVKAPTYSDPLVERRADPDVTLGDDGYYYFTASYPMTRQDDPEGYDRVILRRAKTIQGLKDAKEVSIWDESSTDKVNPYIWAPELQKIGDDWYILFTGARQGGVWDIRPHMLKFTGDEFTGDAVMDAKNWELLGQVKAHEGDKHAFTSFSLDMTAFEANGKHYLVWAEKPGASTIRMAQIDPKDPTQLLGDSIELSTPNQAWEQNDAQNLAVDEGPAVIHHDGKVFVSFSGSSVDRNYAVGLLGADEDADLMDPDSWTKTGYPVLTSDDFEDQVGPGHNSFTTDEYGNPVIVFHSRTENDSSNPGEATDGGLFDPRRHARAKTVHFDLDGEPVFNMTAAEELDPELAEVSYQVEVTGEDPDDGDDNGADADGSDNGSADSDGAGGGSDAGAGAGAGADGSDSASNAGSGSDGGAADGGNNGSEDGSVNGGNGDNIAAVSGADDTAEDHASGAGNGPGGSDATGTQGVNAGGPSPLASTGAQVGTLAAVAAMLLATGAVLILRRKRRS